MARTNIPVTTILITGVADPAEVTGDPTNDHVMTNDSTQDTVLRIRNNGGTARDAIIQIPGSIDTAIANPDRTISVLPGSTVWVGSFNRNIYNQPEPNQDLIYIDVDSADLKFSAFKP